MAKKHGFYFKDWVDFYGRARLAEELGVERSTVHKWASGKSTPEVKFMRAIKKLSRGHVDYVHIIDGIEVEIGAGHATAEA